MLQKCPYSKSFWSVFCRNRTEYVETGSISLYSVQMRENTDQKNSEYGHLCLSEPFFCSSFQNVDQDTDVYDYLKPVNQNTSVIFWCCFTQTKMTFQTFILKCRQDSSMLLWPTITSQAWWVFVVRKPKVVAIKVVARLLQFYFCTKPSANWRCPLFTKLFGKNSSPWNISEESLTC